MSDNKKKKLEDAKYISLAQKHEVEYWTKRFNITKKELNRAVKAAGHKADDVLYFLLIPEEAKKLLEKRIKHAFDEGKKSALTKVRKSK